MLLCVLQSTFNFKLHSKCKKNYRHHVCFNIHENKYSRTILFALQSLRLSSCFFFIFLIEILIESEFCIWFYIMFTIFFSSLYYRLILCNNRMRNFIQIFEKNTFFLYLSYTILHKYYGIKLLIVSLETLDAIFEVKPSYLDKSYSIGLLLKLLSILPFPI